MLEIVLTATVKAVFGEALARLIRMVIRRSQGASDELLLKLVVDTLARHGSHFDHIEDRMLRFERMLERDIPEPAKPLVPRILHKPASLAESPVLDVLPIETKKSFVVELSGGEQFYRVYYESVTLGRNAFRGAASSEDLSLLAGTGVRLDHGTDGVYFRPQPNFPECVVDGQKIIPNDSTLLRVGNHCVTIGALTLQLVVKSESSMKDV
jgi:hypothetical protein